MVSAIGYYVTAIVCIITSFVIHRIYYKEKRRQASVVSLNGIKWFGLAIFSWGLGALLDIILIWIRIKPQTHSKFWGVFFINKFTFYTHVITFNRT